MQNVYKSEIGKFFFKKRVVNRDLARVSEFVDFSNTDSAGITEGIAMLSIYLSAIETTDSELIENTVESPNSIFNWLMDETGPQDLTEVLGFFQKMQKNEKKSGKGSSKK